ncbi:MAG: MBL fold metallo-hydrolase [Hyphomonas sp.]|nr:MBL fold metallo-hydrolase [Hyphomonas sp.]
MAGVFKYYKDVLGYDLGDVKYINVDIVTFDLGEDKLQLFFGDPVVPVDSPGSQHRYKIVGGRFNGRVGVTDDPVPLMDTPILRLSMIDVQQGDGLILDTPSGHLFTIDGGDKVLFARHLAARFSGTTEERPLQIDGMIVTHGDADHFGALMELRESEKETAPERLKKRAFVHPKHVFHNGLIKNRGSRGGKKIKDQDRFGETREGTSGELYVIELEESLFEVPDSRMNDKFIAWRDALVHWNERRRRLGLEDISFHRVEHTSPVFEPFETDKLSFNLFGPITEDVDGDPGLPLLKKPKHDPHFHTSEDASVTKSVSASHTINGHSIGFKLTFGHVSILFTGDLNQQSMDRIDDALPDFNFRAEVLKAPHHGAEDFDLNLLKKVEPIVSLISSGDESAFYEYIHPRANLVSALGKVSRGDTGVIFMTELAAFFRYRGLVRDLKTSSDEEKVFHGFERTNYGIVHIRTNGERLVAFTHSGKRGMNEMYAYSVSKTGKIKPQKRKSIS